MVCNFESSMKRNKEIVKNRLTKNLHFGFFGGSAKKIACTDLMNVSIRRSSAAPAGLWYAAGKMLFFTVRVRIPLPIRLGLNW